MRLLASIALFLLAGCAGYSGRGLVPGQSTEQQVESLMGPASDVRKLTNGETVRYYSRQPYGLQIYAARIGSDGKLIALEERLTEENVAKLRKDRTREEEVRELLGPPFKVDKFPRLQRSVWTYKMMNGPFQKDLLLSFSPDQVVREVRLLDDPDLKSRDGSN